MEWNDPTFHKTIKMKQIKQQKKNHTMPVISRSPQGSWTALSPHPFLFSTLFSCLQDKLKSFLIIASTLLLAPPFSESKPLGQPFLSQRLREANANSMWKPEESRGSAGRLHSFCTLLKAYIR